MNWVKYLFGFAVHAATKSKDTTQVGAAAFGPANNILETGYNGLPRGVADTPERMARPEKYLWTAHAEENLVAHAARPRLEGSTVAVTHLCCCRCARMMVNAGVARVIVGPGKTSMPPREFAVGVEMFAEAGVELVYLEDEV